MPEFLKYIAGDGGRGKLGQIDNRAGPKYTRHKSSNLKRAYTHTHPLPPRFPPPRSNQFSATAVMADGAGRGRFRGRWPPANRVADFCPREPRPFHLMNTHAGLCSSMPAAIRRGNRGWMCVCVCTLLLYVDVRWSSLMTRVRFDGDGSMNNWIGQVGGRVRGGWWKAR